MSLRKTKLLLEHKKLQQQATLVAKNQQKQEEEIEQTAASSRKKNNMFQAFGDDDDDEQQTKKQTKNQENKQKEGQQKQKKKRNKKKKQKAKNDQDLQKQQDVQKVFKQLGMQYKGITKQQEKSTEDWVQILTINENKFNYQKQLRRHFGKVGSLSQKVQQPQMNKKQQKMQKHLRKAMKKSVLSPGVKDFFMISQKFQVERDEDKIKFLPTKKYDHYQTQYQTIRNSNDINSLFMFMQTHPQHVDSIYAVGEFLRLQGNYRDADNLIQRVIYIYEMAASVDFNQFIKQDLVKKQIVYGTYSSSLFMSLFKFMDILGKKGCYRAALEYNKFLLKINMQDPTACMLCIDFNAISSKCSDYLINFIKGFGMYLGDDKSSLYLLPNFTFSMALAKYYQENPDKPEKQLVVQQTNKQVLSFCEQDWKKALIVPNNTSFINQSARVLILRAILIYPKLIVDISNKNQYGKQFLNFAEFEGNQKKTFKQILAHDFWSIVPTSYSYNFLRLENVDDSTGFDKVLEVYVERSKILWKSNQIMLWVKGAMGFILNKIDAKQFDYQEYLQRLCTQLAGGMPIPFNLRRYSKISKANFSDRVERIDLANIQDNQHQQAPRNENRMNLQGNPLTMFLQSLLPWVNLPNSQDPDMPDIQQDD